MHSTIRLALRSLRYHAGKTAKMMLLYGLCAFFLLAEGFLLYSYIASSQQERENTFGIQDGIILCSTEQAVKALQSQAEATGVIQCYAQGYPEKHAHDRQLLLGCIDRGAAKLNRIHATDGRLPQRQDEIAIEKSLLAVAYPKAKMGDPVSIICKLTNHSGQSVEVKRNFTLVGALQNFSQLQWKPENSQGQMINAVVTPEMAKTLSGKPLYSFCSVKLREDTLPGALLNDQLLEQQGIEAFSLNQAEQYSLFSFLNLSNSSLFLILLALLSFLLVFLLYCVSVFHKRDRLQRIGLLKIAGLSNRELSAYFFMQAYMQILPGILIGAAGGILSTYGFLSLEKSFVTFHWSGRLFGGLLAGILLLSLLLSTTGLHRAAAQPVMQVLKPYPSHKTQSKSIQFSSKNPVRLYAVKAFLLNPNQILSSCLLVFFAILIPVCGTFVARGIRQQAEQKIPVDISVLVYDGSGYTPIGIPNDPAKGMSAQDYIALQDNPDVSQSIGVKRLHALQVTKTQPQYYSSQNWQDYHNALQSFDLPEDLYLSDCILASAGAENLQNLAPFITRGKLDLKALSNAQEIIICETKEHPTAHQVGDEIRITQLLNQTPGDYTLSNTQKMDVTVRVGAIATLQQTGAWSTMEDYAFEGLYLWENSSFDQLDVPMHYNHVYLDIADPENTAHINEVLYNMQYLYENYITITDHLQEAQTMARFYQTFSFVSFALAILLILFSLVSMMLAINMKIRMHKQVYGFLRAAGLTKKELYLTILAENLLEILIALGFGVAASVGVCILLSMNMSELPIHLLPVGELIFFILLFPPVMAATCWWPVRSFYRQSIVDCIHTD